MARNAKAMARQGVGVVMALVIAGILIGYVLPIGVSAIFEANTTGWGTAETDLFNLLPLFLVLVVVVVIIGWAMDSF